MPEDKFQKCRLLDESFCKRRKATLQELLYIIGLLNFTCFVIVPGRAFLRRLIDVTVEGRRPHHRIRLSRGTKHDMEVWLKFLREFNGRSPLELYTDAAGLKGYGAIFGLHWFFGSFMDQWQSLNITYLELFAIALSVRIWGSQIANRCMVFVTYNAALVRIINRPDGLLK